MGERFPLAAYLTPSTIRRMHLVGDTLSRIDIGSKLNFFALMILLRIGLTRGGGEVVVRLFIIEGQARFVLIQISQQYL